MPISATIQKKPALLYVSVSSTGGLADYAQQQVGALINVGLDLIVVCPKNVRWPERENCTIYPLIQDKDLSSYSKPVKLLKSILQIRRNISAIIKTQKDTGCLTLLFSAYFEYFSPFWAYKLKRLAKNGVKIATIIHDPIRDAVLGPKWFHDKSVFEAYSFIDYAFIHEIGQIDLGGPTNPHFNVTRVPHGPYPVEQNYIDPNEARKSLGIPKNAKVFLAFGHVRDNKNLDLFIRALSSFPNLWLIVAGQSLSSSQKPFSYYQSLGREENVSDRIIWINRYITEKELGQYFGACDYAVLTYSSSFKSASGVLSLATNFQKLSIASSGPGPLESIIKKYHLGVFVEPDSIEAVKGGISEIIEDKQIPNWEAYKIEESWENNAEIIMKTLFQKNYPISVNG
ncbi:MAG: glycosyltransferase [Verrucomicrobia bacterium]|nr:glycosyltransferase [Verrucomicrobiota bacterium]